jgi:asparagine synthase (glutamine-hydrolysing)
MCGILGWSTPHRLTDDPIHRGLDALAHRGPDGRGAWTTTTRVGGEIALGHTRLAIIDAEGGAQPLLSCDRRFVVSFNGEIYNYIELRETLRARGSKFQTQSDTEVLIEAYRVWGVECLTRLRGMFAFALYDTRDERLVLARDPFGKKPLFLADVAGGVAFASEIAPLLDLPGMGRRLNRAVVGDYLMRRYASGPQTFFQGVRKLPPGCCAVIENGALTERRYFTPPLAEATPLNVSQAYAVTAFRTALEQAVRLRLRSDAPYGVFLSGGLDSSVVAALTVREAGAVSSFAVGFDEADYSELASAERVAARIGARHEALTVTADAFAEAWPAAVRHRGAPVSEASDIPLLLLARAAAGRVKMVLTGEGADELLAGYTKHRAERWIGAYHAAVPPALHRRLLAPLARRLPYDARRWKILSRALGESCPARRGALWFASGAYDEVERLTGQALQRPGAPAATGRSSLRQIMLADQTGWLPDNLLERDDRMLMAAGVEGRAPFMDVDLAALVAGFPDKMLFDRRGGKAILRAAAADLVDAETLNRRKVGFRTPVGEWFHWELKPMLRDLVCGEGASVRRLLDGAAIDRLLEEHLARRTDHTDMLWTVANLELLLREHRLDIED